MGCVPRSDCPPSRRFDDPRRLEITGDGRNAYLVQNQPTLGGYNGINLYDLSAGLLAAPAAAPPCVTSTGATECTPVPGMFSPWDLALSPDGRSAYVVAGLDSGENARPVLRVLARDPASGSLQPVLGTGGCLAAAGAGGCTAMPTQFHPDWVTVSPDGRNVYVTGSRGGINPIDGTIWTFTRDEQTGALASLPGAQACHSDRIRGCARGRALNGARPLVSPDGRSVYLASSDDNALAQFNRDATTGALTQPPGRAGCLQRTGRFRCARDPALRSAGGSFGNGMTMSADSRNLYVTHSDAVLVFKRDAATGALSRLRGRAGCLTTSGRRCTKARGLFGILSIALSPDGKNLYVVNSDRWLLLTFARQRAH